MIVRDKTGRYVWIVEMKTFERIKNVKAGVKQQPSTPTQSQSLQVPEDTRGRRSDSEDDWDFEYVAGDDEDMIGGEEDNDLPTASDKIVTEPIIQLPLYKRYKICEHSYLCNNTNVCLYPVVCC